MGRKESAGVGLSQNPDSYNNDKIKTHPCGFLWAIATSELNGTYVLQYQQ
jgi:hypothetical protein